MQSLKKILVVLAIIIVSIICINWLLLYKLIDNIDPLASYEYNMEVGELKSKVMGAVKRQPGFTFTLREVVGNETKGFGYYARIKDGNNNYEYVVEFIGVKSFWKRTVTSEIQLISAFNLTRRQGGYKISDPEVRSLMDTLEVRIISKIN